ncbi:hypothetical protein MRX96_024185 [Rhipicephalus microplus]
MKMDVPVVDGFCRDVKRLREDATGMGTHKENFHVQEKSGEISVCFRIPPYGYKPLRRPVEKTRHSLHSVLSVSAVCQRGHGVFWTSRS